jgi:hypothetical protein
MNDYGVEFAARPWPICSTAATTCPANSGTATTGMVFRANDYAVLNSLRKRA